MSVSNVIDVTIKGLFIWWKDVPVRGKLSGWKVNRIQDFGETSQINLRNESGYHCLAYQSQFGAYKGFTKLRFLGLKCLLG